MPSPPQVLSIQVGRTQQFDSPDDAGDGSAKLWESAINKEPVVGPVFISTEYIEGDQQADLVHHGGPDKAVCAYPSEHYEYWSETYCDIQWGAGYFGENLTLAGLLEPDVCIGDTFEVGECVLQVSQPRQPCWKLSRRWKLPKLAVHVQRTRLTGWYFRVLQPGVIEVGQAMRMIDRLDPKWTISAANEIMFAKPRDATRDQELAACPVLSQSWRETLLRRAAESSDSVPIGRHSIARRPG